MLRGVRPIGYLPRAATAQRLGDLVKLEQDRRRKLDLDEKPDTEVSEELRGRHRQRQEKDRRGGLAGRFRRYVKRIIVDCMKSSIQVMFYACDYSTKPNMTCAPLLVAMRDGIRRLEAQLQAEEEDARVAELQASAMPSRFNPASSSTPTHLEKAKRRVLTKQENEARRRLIRQATAANQAVVKGNCLMAMQLLTRREVLRTHFPWQLMMKHCMWLLAKYDTIKLITP